MTSQVKLVTSGVWPTEAAAASGGDFSTNIALSSSNSTTFTASGSGTSQTSTAAATVATQLYQMVNDNNIFTTVGATYNSAQLPNQGSAFIVVFNNGANVLLVFPPYGGNINQQTANFAFGVTAGKSTTFISSDGLNWIAQHAG